jgi:hypothetical protein
MLSLDGSSSTGVTMYLIRKFVLLEIFCLVLLPCQAFAYVGPGLGAGTLGVLFGLLGSMFLALFAFIWYPIKRLIFRKGAKSQDEIEDDDSPAVEAKPNLAENSKNP